MASLDFKVEKEKFCSFYDANYINFKNSVDLLINLIKTLLNSDNSIHIQQILGRIKDKTGCITKFCRKYQANLESQNKEYEIKDHITDLLGLRVVCLYEDEIGRIKEILESNFAVIDITNKILHLEEHDDTFGYKALHIDVKLDKTRHGLPEYQICRDNKYEIQIRTIVQDAWSVLDHNIKYKKSIPLKLKRRINALSALFDIADREFLSVRDETKHQETQADEGHTVDKTRSSTLDAFQFLSVMKHHFPTDSFPPKAIDSFVQDLTTRKKDISRDFLEKVILNGKSVIDKYCDYLLEERGDTMNSFTKLRHLLYLHDGAYFYPMLYSIQRSSFEDWLTRHKNQNENV